MTKPMAPLLIRSQPCRHFWLGPILGCLLASFLLGCRIPTLRDPNATRTQPSKPALVGVWVPDRYTLETMREKGGYDTSNQTKLVLKNDGTFELVNMPDWWSGGFGQSHKGFEDHTGTWRTLNYGDTGIWHIDLRATSGTRLVNLVGQTPPYQLEFVIGDPDSNVSMIFTKQ
jgi:hypothetical protein